MSAESRLNKVLDRINLACLKSGRDPKEVHLVAVSKTQSLEKIRALYEAGQRSFGENYVQEALPKIEQLENCDLNWHFIGPLQSNKVRKMIGRFSLIHSVDRMSLINEIARQCEMNGLEQKILIQVNLSEEPSKTGTQRDQVEALLNEALKFKPIKICGLMTMPPLTKTAEENRAVFALLRALLIDLQEKYFKDGSHPFSELSMGTSQDFEVAVEEGATLIRIGTELFGPREVTK